MTKNVAAGNLTVEQYKAGVPYRSSRKPEISAGTIQSFKIENTKAQSSKGFVRIGLPFVQGDIPRYAAPKIIRGGESVAAQFDQRRTWPDGSLGFAVCTIRDSDFTSSEERTYEVTVDYDAYDNSSTKTLTDITSNTDFNVNITNAVNSSAATYNGGTLTASFNTQAGVATRVTKTHSGPVCDEYEVWGMCQGSTEDDHLKTVWHVTAYKDSQDNIVDYCYGAKMCQDWWDAAGKDALTYDLELRNGVASVQSYIGVNHYYHSHWVTVRLTNDDQYGRRHWVNASPSLHYKPDQVYFIKSGYIDSYDLTLANTALNTSTVYDSPYIPCDNLDHRANVDATGGYMGRSRVANSDIIAFLSQDKTRTRHARVNAFAGLHIPYHYKEQAQRTRVGESADVANTILALDLSPKAQSFFDFTSEGMPATKVMSNDSRSAVEDQAGWVEPTGGTGDWYPSGDASHAVNYSYFMYILEGERYFMDATFDLTMNNAVNLPTSEYGQQPLGFNYADDAYRQALFNIPTDQWNHIAGLNANSNIRAIGWSLNIMSSAYAVAPDDELQSGSIKALVDHNLDWMAQSIDYLPQDQVDRGIFQFQDTTTSPWMLDYVSLYSISTNRLVQSADSKKIADLTCKYPAFQGNDPLYYNRSSYRATYTQKKGAWHADDNPFVSEIYAFSTDCSTTASTNTVTAAAWIKGMELADGDKIKFVSRTNGASVVPIPAGINEGQVYYVINKSGFDFKVSETLGGSEVDITDDVSCNIEIRPAIAATTPAVYDNPYLPGEDSYDRIRYASLISAHEHDPTIATQSMIDSYRAFLINSEFVGSFLWAYRENQVT